MPGSGQFGIGRIIRVLHAGGEFDFIFFAFAARFFGFIGAAVFFHATDIGADRIIAQGRIVHQQRGIFVRQGLNVRLVEGVVERSAFVDFDAVAIFFGGPVAKALSRVARSWRVSRSREKNRCAGLGWELPLSFLLV